MICKQCKIDRPESHFSNSAPYFSKKRREWRVRKRKVCQRCIRPVHCHRCGGETELHKHYCEACKKARELEYNERHNELSRQKHANQIFLCSCGRVRERRRRLCGSCLDAALQVRRACPRCGNERGFKKQICSVCMEAGRLARQKKAREAAKRPCICGKPKEPRKHYCEACRAERRAGWKSIKMTDAGKERLAKWRQENPDKVKKMNSVKNARRTDRDRQRTAARCAPDALKTKEWRRAVEFFGGCAYCGKPSETLNKDHFIPAVRGGGFTADNIVPSCPKCNYKKSDKLPGDFLKNAPELLQKIEKYFKQCSSHKVL